MVLLSKDELDTYAPLIGAVVLHCAHVESLLYDTEEKLIDALDRVDLGLVELENGHLLNNRLKKIRDALRRLNAPDLDQRFKKLKSMLNQINDQRNNIVHGNWWSDLFDDTAYTHKISPPSKTFELYVVESIWTPGDLIALIERIKDAVHELRELEEEIAVRFLGIKPFD